MKVEYQKTSSVCLIRNDITNSQSLGNNFKLQDQKNDSWNGWKTRISNLECNFISGSHFKVFDPDNIENTALAIQSALNSISEI